MTLTRKGAATRARIVEGAAGQIREEGVFALRLEDVMARTATSKSQLFHYFPGGKDELLLAVAHHEADRILDDQQPELGALTSWEAWWRWRDKVVARYRAQGAHCPLQTALSRRGPAASDAARAVAGRLMDRWQEQIAAGIRHLQDAGEVTAGLDAEREAAALLAGVQGGVAILLATGSTIHLEAALDSGLARLREARPAD
ncbi:TetR/AcrR family transcriptional regulator [Streptomyces sp. CBMA123]|uniref:TetR/AcrR family transcriptional regulator n=1 Tax=Streptomyces sp. CBMA123 TaxID=1896313 RepID=UPI0016620F70|nr:TetR family transcriptional regulator [Streptomyces sp. CBMA123]MBD0689517.1 TetR family transcriptional regulator [Streptomyces sp. CBMA123]